MASSVKLKDMILSVRRRADIVSQTGFISDAEITEYLNYCISDLYDLLVQAGGQEFFRKTQKFTTNNNTDTYDLRIVAPDFYRLISVDAYLSGDASPNSNIVLSVKPFMEEERNRFKWYPGWLYNRPVYYRLQGNNITFIPAPSGNFTVGLNYFPEYHPLVSDNDDFDGINGWEEHAIWRAAAYCKQKGEDDPSFCMARVSELESRINALAQTRDSRGAERVNDVTSSYDEWY